MRKVLATAALVIGALCPLGAQAPSALKIVVLEGEGAVNIIQQKTAVRPLVEVRERNNVPVAGATVTFTIGGGGQSAVFAGGAQTLTVTTNAAGQAAASGLNALSSGAVQIQVQAAYQGQIATAAISQTNFATAAAATQAGASAGGSGGATSGAAGGAAGGGGGISGTTIGILGAAVGGGALVASKTVLDKTDGDSAAAGASTDNYNGTMSGQLALISVSTNAQGQASSCTRSHVVSGPIRISLRSGNATGDATAQFTIQEVAVTAPCGPVSQPITFTLNRENTPVSGGPAALTFRGVAQLTSVAYAVAFNGALSGNTIAGTLSIDATSQGPFDSNRPNYTGSTSFPVTLTK